VKIRWITPHLGTAPAVAVKKSEDIVIIDVRNLVDSGGNPTELIVQKINQGIISLKNNMRTVVCCDLGMSRSNAIATGIFAAYYKTSFAEALTKVQRETGETEIKLGPLTAVRRAIEPQIKKNHSTVQKSILVTGGTGLIGEALVSCGRNEFTFLSPKRDELDISSGSTLLYIFIIENNIDCIVHLSNSRVYTSNVAMGQSIAILRNVIDVCLATDTFFVYLSCWEIYGGYAKKLSADEETPYLPIGVYGETKYLSELLISHHSLARGLRCALLRLSKVYGTEVNRPRFIFNFIEKALKSETIITHLYKNGPPYLDLLHVDDLVSAILAVINKGYIGKLNIGTGVLTSTHDIAGMIKNHFSSNSKIEHILIDKTVTSVAMNWNRAKNKLNWSPKISFKDGLGNILSQFESKRGDFGQ